MISIDKLREKASIEVYESGGAFQVEVWYSFASFHVWTGDIGGTKKAFKASELYEETLNDALVELALSLDKHRIAIEKVMA